MARKAWSDLLSARVLVANQPPILDTACFHCQQVAEKSLKAYLVFKGVVFEKTHSMSYLLGMCLIQDTNFTSVQEQAEFLNPFAVEVRYPGDAVMPSAEESDEALAATTAIWSFVLTQLPEECHPSRHQSS
ncbi:MAG: HEPN domain-containing protein [Chloroflexi bacterium]|nr:HEPN domain-containing protein [Chloroflexota bacterium]